MEEEKEEEEEERIQGLIEEPLLNLGHLINGTNLVPSYGLLDWGVVF